MKDRSRLHDRLNRINEQGHGHSHTHTHTNHQFSSRSVAFLNSWTTVRIKPLRKDRCIGGGSGIRKLLDQLDPNASGKAAKEKRSFISFHKLLRGSAKNSYGSWNGVRLNLEKETLCKWRNKTVRDCRFSGSSIMAVYIAIMQWCFRLVNY